MERTYVAISDNSPFGEKPHHMHSSRSACYDFREYTTLKFRYTRRRLSQASEYADSLTLALTKNIKWTEVE